MPVGKSNADDIGFFNLKHCMIKHELRKIDVVELKGKKRIRFEGLIWPLFNIQLELKYLKVKIYE